MFVGSHDIYTLTATCDDYLKVYVDGVEASPSNHESNEWRISTNYSVTACNSLIAIFCRDNAGDLAGLLASTTTGVLTDTTWRCTDQLEDGWQTLGFTESAGVWGAPGTHGNNIQAPGRRSVAGINLLAEWIWYGPYDEINRKTVYCRKNI